MPDLANTLLQLYLPLGGWIFAGWLLGQFLPKVFSSFLGSALFWVGVPITITGFLYRADLSGWILIAPIVAWIAIIIGAIFAFIWIDLGVKDERIKALSRGLDDSPSTSSTAILRKSAWSKPTQGSFLLAMMVGNTGYMGFPVVLNLVGADYFAWALFYDILGTFIGVYGVGVVLATRYGKSQVSNQVNLLKKLLQNPAFWSLGLGLLLRPLPLPTAFEQGLETSAWIVVNMALVLIGLQLSQLKSLQKLNQVIPCLGIKMVLVPLVVGTGLMFFGVTAEPRLALVLQMGMPPAFATVVFAEAYGLDRDLAVTTIAFGCLGLIVLLPIWMLLFGTLS